MANPTFGWTKPLPTAQQRADPSGVQEASSTLQAILLSGMSTVTTNVRYIPLFVAARYYRQQAGEGVQANVGWVDFFRRLEALIAVASVRHHSSDGRIPRGIIGDGAGRRLSELESIELRTDLQVPPYSIYRGTLSGLGLVDIDASSDPLRESALRLAAAWKPSADGVLTTQVQAGVLPETVSRAMVDAEADSFCLCQVPAGSKEQEELARVLMGLGKSFPLPTFAENENVDRLAYRSVSWRLALELVNLSPGRVLADYHLMARLLEPDLLEAAMHSCLRACLYCWRWVAARTFFELAWTLLFSSTLSIVKNAPHGLTSADLHEEVGRTFGGEWLRETMDQTLGAARAHAEEAEWLEARFESDNPRDLLLAMCAGVMAANRDRTGGSGLLGTLWQERAIPFAVEHERLSKSAARSQLASEYWGELGEQTLVQHVRGALRRMSSGNPDSLHVDFDNGRWMVPAKAINWNPQPAGGSSRLDVALGWARQMGLVEASGPGLQLTVFGRHCCNEWDREHVQ